VPQDGAATKMRFDVCPMSRQDVDHVLKALSLAARISHTPIIVIFGYDVKPESPGAVLAHVPWSTNPGARAFRDFTVPTQANQRKMN
jgi:ribulose 1,5-bisphosphate carboxylase large subunit-like protein